MTTPTKETEGLNIVFFGAFNPAIFVPLWFSNNNLIRKEEAENAKIKIIAQQAAIFNTDWFSLSVLADRYTILTEKSSHFEVLKDLVKGTFQLLCHTPVQKMGINWIYHFKMNSEEEWHAFGDKLAPKELWKKIFSKPGMRRIEIQDIKVGGYPGLINVLIEPSSRLSKYGILMRINDHFDIDKIEDNKGFMTIVDKFEEIWKNSKIEAEKIVQSLWE